MFEDPEFWAVYIPYLKRMEPDLDPAHLTTPVLYFFGEMQAPSTSMMTGRVWMSFDNQIQWPFVSCGHSFTRKEIIFLYRFLVIKVVLSGTVSL